MIAHQRKINVFNQISLDGYFTDVSNDMSWAHKYDPEATAFADENASGSGPLLFGRVTYEMMAAFWPTPMALQQMPVVSKGMNARPKLVVSRTLQELSWNNAKLLKGDLLEEVRKLKAAPSEDVTILGSGSIVAQLAGAGLIDQFAIMLNPVALGGGRTMFDGIPGRLNLKRTGVRTFGNGNVLLSYEVLN